jgi:hypothetical protein
MVVVVRPALLLAKFYNIRLSASSDFPDSSLGNHTLSSRRSPYVAVRDVAV